MERLAKSERFWDKNSFKFDERTRKYKQNYAWIINTTRKYLHNEDIVMDYACGTGTVTIELASQVREIEALDISSGMLEIAKRKASGRNIQNVNFIHSTLFDERYRAGSFDAVLALNILHLLQDPARALQRINELIKPGGLLISTTACLKENKNLSLVFISMMAKTGFMPDVRFFNISELENMVKDAGFYVIEKELLEYKPTNCFIVARKN